MLKNWIFERMEHSRRLINQELNSITRYRKAMDINYHESRNRVMRPMMMSSMPHKYEEQIDAIFWFCWKREVSNNILFPVLFKGKLYSKWDEMPEECKEAQKDGMSKDIDKKRPYPIFKWHFTEGMDAE